MADWDQEDFEPDDFQVKNDDQWEGEDEDENGLKENWDDEESEESKKAVETPAPAPTTKKKSVKQKILEKEAQRQEEATRKAQEIAENIKNNEDDDESPFSSKIEEKLRQQKLVEESDLEVAKDLFGGIGGKKSIDTFEPKSKEEFTELAKMIVDRLSNFESSGEYPGFLEVLIRDLATGIDATEVKKLSSVLNILASEKQKAEKGPGKVKKKTKKAVLGGGAKGTKGVDLSDYANVTYADEFDDFM